MSHLVSRMDVVGVVRQIGKFWSCLVEMFTCLPEDWVENFSRKHIKVMCVRLCLHPFGPCLNLMLTAEVEIIVSDRTLDCSLCAHCAAQKWRLFPALALSGSARTKEMWQKSTMGSGPLRCNHLGVIFHQKHKYESRENSHTDREWRHWTLNPIKQTWNVKISLLLLGN